MVHTAAVLRREDSMQQKANFIPIEFGHLRVDSDSARRCYAKLTVLLDGRPKFLEADGNGPIDAVCVALREIVPNFNFVKLYIANVEEGSDATARCAAHLTKGGKTVIGEGIDTNMNDAAAKAVIAGLNQLRKREVSVA